MGVGNLSPDDVEKLKNIFKDVFVTKDSCGDNHKELNEKINNISIDVATQKNDVNSIKRLLQLIEGTMVSTIVGGIIAAYIAMK